MRPDCIPWGKTVADVTSPGTLIKWFGRLSGDEGVCPFNISPWAPPRNDALCVWGPIHRGPPTSAPRRRHLCLKRGRSGERGFPPTPPVAAVLSFLSIREGRETKSRGSRVTFSRRDHPGLSGPEDKSILNVPIDVPDHFGNCPWWLPLQAGLPFSWLSHRFRSFTLTLFLFSCLFWFFSGLFKCWLTDTRTSQQGGKIHESRGGILYFHHSQSSLSVAEYKISTHLILGSLGKYFAWCGLVILGRWVYPGNLSFFTCPEGIEKLASTVLEHCCYKD